MGHMFTCNWLNCSLMRKLVGHSCTRREGGGTKVLVKDIHLITMIKFLFPKSFISNHVQPQPGQNLYNPPTVGGTYV